MSTLKQLKPKVFSCLLSIPGRNANKKKFSFAIDEEFPKSK